MAYAPMDTLFDSVLDFLASTPTLEQIVAYQPAEALQQRMSALPKRLSLTSSCA